MKEIRLTKGQVAIVDDEDFEWLNQWKWLAVKLRSTYYAMRVVYEKSQYKETILMHRLILGLTGRKEIADHKDHNGLNNQKSNLRIATHSENMANRCARKNSSSKFLGVSKNIKTNKWRAKIQTGGQCVHIGNFTDEKDAAIAYNKKAKEVHGDFANLNIV